MKKSLVFFLTLVPCILLTLQMQCKIAYVFKVSISNNISEKPRLAAYYKGYQIDMPEQWTLLPEDEKQSAFSVVIAKDFNFATKNNTVRYLKRKKNEPVAWFDLTLIPKRTHSKNKTSSADSQNTYEWIIEKRDPKEVPVRIPDHSIVILFDPAYIEDMVDEHSPINENLISLPTLVFSNDVDPEDFKEAAIEAAMAELNLDAIHKKEWHQPLSRGPAMVVSIAKK